MQVQTRVPLYGPTLGSYLRVPPQGPGFSVSPQGPESHFSSMPTTKKFSRLKSKTSHRRCSINKAVLKNFAIFIGKHLC